MRRRGRVGADAWLGALAYLVKCEGPRDSGRILWESIRDEWIAEGHDPHWASERAARAVKLGREILLGVEQREAAQELGMSERTAKRDVQRLRGLS